MIWLHSDPNEVDCTPLQCLASLESLALDVFADRHGLLPYLLRAIVSPALTELTIQGIASGALPERMVTNLHKLHAPWTLMAAHATSGGPIEHVLGWRSLGSRSFANLQSLQLVCSLGSGELAAVLRAAAHLPRLEDLEIYACPYDIVSDTWGVAAASSTLLMDPGADGFGNVGVQRDVWGQDPGKLLRIGVCRCPCCVVR